MTDILKTDAAVDASTVSAEGPASEWHAANDQYLAASLQWLRLVLAHEEPAAAVPPAVVARPETEPVPQPSTRRGFWRWLLGSPEPQPRVDSRGDAAHAAGVHPDVPAGDKRLSAAERIAAAAADRRRAANISPPPALEVLAEQLGLTEYERDLLLLCTAMELDTSIATRCAFANGDAALAFPTYALAMRVFPGAAWDAVSPRRALRYWHLVEPVQGAGQSLTTSALRADERIVNYVKGLNELDERIERLVASVGLRHGGSTKLPPTLEAKAQEVVRRFRQTAPGAPTPVLQLLGSDSRAKLDIAARAVAALDRVLVRVPVELLPSQPLELDLLARLWHREAVLLPIALYIEAEDTEDARDISALGRFLARSDGVFLLGTREPRSELDRPTAGIEVSRPRPAEQRDAWVDAIGPGGPPGIADALAAQFDLAPSAIAEIVEGTAAEAPLGADPESYIRLWDACIAGTRVPLDQLAERIEPRAAWEDIVLPGAETALLRQIADQVAQRTRVYEDWGFGDRMSRGLGISVLFTGPSGTGKTMAAEVLASHLRLNLYRIDLSAVVSKYIGETEKNLRRLFDAAESGPALLFFDEADALFGKRSEVKDAHDRYANIEINYLLQRMESYRGLAVLATNMRRALDQAFLRRLRFIVTFPFPGAEQRRAIWEKAFPPRAWVKDLDYDRLGKLPATGAMVQNIALNAAFMAAQAGRPVTMALVMDAASVEFKKLEVPVSDAALALGERPAPLRLEVGQ